MAKVQLLRAAPPDDERRAFADDVRRGLQAARKSLPCRWFYDAAGSALFEEICELPEYTIPRAERALLERHGAEMLRARPRSLVELGSGNSAKTRVLLDALAGPATYVAIDVSESALAGAAEELAARYPLLDVVALAGTYEQGLARLDGHAPGPRLVLWLGSNVGNYARAEAARFLAGVRRRLAAGDGILMGVDLRKDDEELLRAYDDPAGVTARFNLNLLARINRELHGDLDLDAFEHRVAIDDGVVRMYLVARRPVRARIAALGLDVELAAGEAIHTEDSTKYSPDEIRALAAAAGLAVEGEWREAGFAEVLLRCAA
jgi:L-histidine N-alpha-methyltransferase